MLKRLGIVQGAKLNYNFAPFVFVRSQCVQKYETTGSLLV